MNHMSVWKDQHYVWGEIRGCRRHGGSDYKNGGNSYGISAYTQGLILFDRIGSIVGILVHCKFDGEPHKQTLNRIDE